MRVVRVIVAWALLCAPAVAQAPEDLLAAAGRLMDTNEYVPAIDIHNSIPESAPAPIREIGAGRTPEEALRRTKIAYVDHPQYAHPFYWSSLVITGDGAQALVTEPLGPAEGAVDPRDSPVPGGAGDRGPTSSGPAGSLDSRLNSILVNSL